MISSSSPPKKKTNKRGLLPMGDDGELLVRASAVPKSQGAPKKGPVGHPLEKGEGKNERSARIVEEPEIQTMLQCDPSRGEGRAVQ